MTSLVWSPRALRDIQTIFRFLNERTPHSPEIARRAIAAIRKGCVILRTQPQIGRPIEELDPAFREWLIDFGDSGYAAMYHFDGQRAVILAVRHQKEAGY